MVRMKELSLERRTTERKRRKEKREEWKEVDKLRDKETKIK